MGKNQVIQINKFSGLHDGKKIIFCKTDYILREFEYIKSLSNDVILITGNSDYCITDSLASQAPKNIVAWFCQNKLCDNPLLKAIPLGVENTVPCKREGHGKVWGHAKEKLDYLVSSKNKAPKLFSYANFNVNTNPHHRSVVKKVCENAPHITWQDPTLPYHKFVSDILNHQAVVCAQGNDAGDNHRIYESLYLDRVPITFNEAQYKYLHHLYPTILITDTNELYNEDILRGRVSTFKVNKVFLDIEFWMEYIYDEAKKYSIVG